MLFRAYRMLYRRRFFAAAFIVLLTTVFFVVLAIHLHENANHPATGNLNPVLTSLSFVSLLVGIIFGASAAIHPPGFPNQLRFLLTRPNPLRVAQFYPLAIATVSIVGLPALGWIVVLGVLRLAYPPLFGRLTEVVAAYPRVLLLGSHPSLSATLGAMQAGKRYLAAVSVGLAVFTCLAALRWCTLSTRKRLRRIGMFGLSLLPSLLICMNLVWHSPISQAILLAQLRRGTPDYLPSNLGIALHFVFAAVCLCAQFAVMRDREI
jgi:hypothetical protein